MPGGRACRPPPGSHPRGGPGRAASPSSHPRRRTSLSDTAPAFRAQVRSLLTRGPVTCPRDASIAAASQTMATEGVGSIVVLGPDGRPQGIVTDRDLRERVVAAGRSADEPVTAVMSGPLVSLSPEAFVFEALLEMTRRDIHHLAVVEGGRLVGVVSSHDLLRLQAAAPLEIGRLIQSRASLDQLGAVMPELTRVVEHLFEQGTSGYELGRIVAELNDQVIRRVLVLVERDLRDEGVGEPPVPFCWLALGSEGRREQTIKTDQDNALVYADPSTTARPAAATYFTAFAERAIDGLVRLGFPRCPADSMASNPKWRQPLAVWREYFAAWVRDPVPEHLLFASIYFDFRPIAGAPELAEALRDEIRSRVGAWRSFPRYLGKIAVSHGPALGFFGRFRLQRKDGVRGIDLKLSGLLILVNALRAYAVELGLDETNTIERLEAVRRAGGTFGEDEADAVRRAYETIFRLRLGHQLARLAAGAAPDNFVDPYRLSRQDQQRLKDAFRAIHGLQGRVEDRYLTQML